MLWKSALIVTLYSPVYVIFPGVMFMTLPKKGGAWANQ